MQLTGLSSKQYGKEMKHLLFLKQCCGSVLHNPTKAFLPLLMLKVFSVVVHVSHLKSHCILEKGGNIIF